MKKALKICAAGTMNFVSYSAENTAPEVSKAVEDRITKDYDQDTGQRILVI